MSWKKHQLGDLLEYYSVRAKDIGNISDLEFCGVSNEEGITISKYAVEDKAEDYKVIEKGCFAYNPYRINVGSIALMQKEKKGLISPAYVVFKPKPNSIVPELLLKFLKSSEGLRQIKQNARGTVRQALRFEDLCKIEISLPEYEEQIELYTNLELTQNKCYKISSDYEKQIDLLKKLRQQILQDAVQGKLVPQDPNDEPASKLLERIKAEKEILVREKKIKKEKPSLPIKPEEIPFEIPDNWAWCRLGELADEILGGHAFDSQRYSKFETNNQVIRLGNVKPNQLVLSTNPVYIDNDYAEEAKKSKLLSGDILITMTGTRAKRDYLFTLLIYEEDLSFKELYLNQRVGCFRFASTLSKEFLNHTLTHKRLLDPVFLSATGAANQANIGVAALRDIFIPLAPINEQYRIVTKINQLMTLCDELEQTIQQNQKNTQELLQVALKEALEPKN